MSTPPPPEAVLLIGVQASGKSSFAREKLFDSHVRINLDMLRTRNRETRILDACLDAGQSFVIDNTNPTRQERARYIEAAQPKGFRIVGYYFQSEIEASLRRNAAREAADRVPDVGVRGTHARLELPSPSEGFDSLFYVSLTPEGFCVQEWQE
jgi:predicted kinase